MGPYVDPIGSGLQPARIDMGVDYTGAGQIYAMGAGTIANVTNSGWPGGKFISLKLDEGPYAGKYVYYAENISTSVKVGQHVSAGQPIGTALGSYPFIEIGWAAPPGTGQTMASQSGQSTAGEAAGDPGKYSTAYGVAMSDLIKSLGGPAGIMSPGGVKGSVPAGFNTTASNTGSSNALPGCVALVGVCYALFHTQKCGWHVPRRQRRYWRRQDEKRVQEGSQEANEASVRD